MGDSTNKGGAINSNRKVVNVSTALAMFAANVNRLRCISQ